MGIQQTIESPRIVVGVGASAGGLEALRRLLHDVPSDAGLTFVVILHLAPTHESHMVELLAAGTSLQVVQIDDEQPLEANRIYVIAPDRVVSVDDDVLRSTVPDDPRGTRRPVDTLLSSLATSLEERAVAVILSGTGHDGSAGIRDVKAAGGLCLVQAPNTAEYDGMPESAIATGVAHRVLPPEDMPDVLLEYARAPGVHPPPDTADEATGPLPDDFEQVLHLLGRTYGVNFRSAYKRGTLARRTERRMALKQTPDWQAYRALLERDPSEVAALYRDVLIGVTGFFRDHEMWDYMSQEILPELLREFDAEGAVPFKIWVPGCATGEEAYSFAMICLEQIQRMRRAIKLQVFATDIAEDALAQARLGRYPETIQESVSPERLAKFFTREGSRFRVNQELREVVTFATHNLLSDPPFSRMDVVSCRNVLIYLEAHAQRRVLELLHFALKPGGLLVLGASETIGRHGDLFQPVSNKSRVFKSRATTTASRHHKLQWLPDRIPVHPPPAAAAASPTGPRVNRIVEQIVLRRYTWACVAVTESFAIQSFFGPTHEYLVQPTGEARMDLLAWLRPGLYPKVRDALEQAVARKEPIHLTGLRMDRDGSSQPVECTIEPIAPLPDEAPLFIVAFRDLPPPANVEVTAPSDADKPLVRQLEAELKQVREELHGTRSQLDHAHEEYRASHEELLSLNEELQSNNEELEASKEELQSLNEEMITINRQLEERNLELRSANADIHNLLVSADIPIIFLDRALRIRRFTPAATEVMHLLATDVGRSVEDIRERFHDGGLVQDAWHVLKKLAPVEAEVQAEDGRWYVRRVLPYRTEDDRIDGVCIAFHDITEQREAARQLDEARLYAEAIVSTVRTALVVLDPDLRVVSANLGFYETFHVEPSQVQGCLLYEVGNGQWNIPQLRNLLERVLPDELEVTDYDVEHSFEHIGKRVMLVNARLMRVRERARFILLSIEDITERKAAEEAARLRADDLALEHRRKDEFLAMLGHELRNPLSALMHGLDLLELDADDAERRGEIHATMVRQAKRMSSMLDQLLDVARLTAGKVRIAQERLELADVVRGASEAVAPLIEAAQHELKVAIPSDEPMVVVGDFMRLVQVVENLLTNAAKYTEPGGRIELSVEPERERVRIRVRDTGIGMAPELLPHVFDLFTQEPRTLGRARGGLGLGLSLVKQVVELHGGTVEASSPGRSQGSEFVVTLPRQEGRPEVTHHDARPPASGTEVPPRRILVIDNEVDAATMLTKILATHGHEVRMSTNGPEGLKIAETLDPDLVLLDLGLPNMDGYEVARRLRAQPGGQRRLLIAVTGYQEDPPRLAEAGFDHHLLKPPDSDTLFRWLRDLNGG